jgi:hypothetical protein
MKRGSYRAAVEPLESREVLSVAAPVADGHFIAFSGRGVGVVTSLNAIPNGSFRTVTNLSGSIHGLGAFQGQILAFFAPNQFQVVGGNAVLADAAGDELFANVTGRFNVPVKGASHTSGVYTLIFTGGAGALAGAAGSATIDVSQNVSNGNLKFNLQGRVVTP